MPAEERHGQNKHFSPGPALELSSLLSARGASQVSPARERWVRETTKSPSEAPVVSRVLETLGFEGESQLIS